MTPDNLPPGPLRIALVPLRATSYRGAYRYAAYLLNPVRPDDGGVSQLWGDPGGPDQFDTDRKREAPATWPGLVYFPKHATAPDIPPAYHFALDFAPSGWGTDDGMRGWAAALARRAARPVTGCMLAGWYSRAVEGRPPAV